MTEIQRIFGKEKNLDFFLARGESKLVCHPYRQSKKAEASRRLSFLEELDGKRKLAQVLFYIILGLLNGRNLLRVLVRDLEFKLLF